MILPVIRVDRRGKLVHPVQWKDLWFGVGGCGLDLATHAYSWITTKCHDYNNTWCGMSRLDMTRLSRFGRLPLPRPTWGLQRLNTWTTRSRRSSCQGLKVGGLECVLQCTRSQRFFWENWCEKHLQPFEAWDQLTQTSSRHDQVCLPHTLVNDPSV